MQLAGVNKLYQEIMQTIMQTIFHECLSGPSGPYFSDLLKELQVS